MVMISPAESGMEFGEIMNFTNTQKEHNSQRRSERAPVSMVRRRCWGIRVGHNG